MEVHLKLDGHGRTTWDTSVDQEVSIDLAEKSESSISTEKSSSSIDYNSKTVMTSSLVTPQDASPQELKEWQDYMDKLLFDCEIADCALMPRTFWMPADGTEPRCAFEKMALDVFHHHVPKDLVYDASSSGAEWWVQLRPSPPGIGRYAMLDTDPDEMSKNGISFHWDKDEDLRIAAGGSLYIHPHLSTVTYLTSLGAPTVALNCRVHPMTGDWLVPGTREDLEEDKVEAFVSWPLQGKHLSFDGRFLHAAPPDLMEEGAFKRQCDIPKVSLRSSAKDEMDRMQKVLLRRHRRVTFLVNVWLNYHPFNVNPFPDTMLDKLTPISESPQMSSLFGSSGEEAQSSPVVSVDNGLARNLRSRSEEQTVAFAWPMGGCDSHEKIQADVPLKFVRQQSSLGGNVRICWETSTGDSSHAGVVLSKPTAEKQEQDGDKQEAIDNPVGSKEVESVKDSEGSPSKRPKYAGSTDE
jgi:hypothetical protein